MTDRRPFLQSSGAPIALMTTFVLLVGVCIRKLGIWIDESATLLIVKTNGYGELVQLTKLDSHPPLWYLILKPWLQLFGTSLVAARAQSALFMTAALALWYRFFSTRFDRTLGLLALALMATNPTFVHYAVEARMYALGVLLTAISSLLVTSQRRHRWIAYWLTAVVMLYIHYFLAFVLASQFVYLLITRREQERSVRWLVLFGASILVPFLVWIPFALSFTSKVVTTGYWIPPTSPSTAIAYVLDTFLHRTVDSLLGWRAMLGLLVLVLLTTLLIRSARLRSGPYVLLWCTIAIPWFLLFALSSKVPLFHPRYVIFGLPMLVGLLAAGALTLKRRWMITSIAVLIIGQLYGIVVMRAQGNYKVANWYSMKRIAEDIAKPRDGQRPLVVATHLFPFFDAKAMIGDHQRVVQLRPTPPSRDSFPDALYVDRPDWYILSLEPITDHYVWLLDSSESSPTSVPANWELLQHSTRGYAVTRLFRVNPPTAGATPIEPTKN